jgi:excisionase family DNA binding protein
MAKEDWITTAEAVKLTRYHVNHIRRLLKSGEVKAQKWGREWQVSRSSLLAHVAKSEKSGAKRGPKTPA